MQMAGSNDRLKGTVKWFDVRRGFGFITPENGGEAVFVHQSSIKAVDFRSLAVGETVEFVVSVGDDGRTRAVIVTGPGGAYIKGRRYFGGSCYRCGEVGHMAMDCKSDGGCAWFGPCYNCGEMGHLARECPAMRFEPYSPRANVLEPSNLSISAFSPPMGMPLDILHGDNKSPNLFDQLSQSMEFDEDEDFPRVVEERNWAELPRDVLLVIFKKIAAVQVITSVQFVCRPWHQLSREPELWRCIDMMNQAGCFKITELESIAMMIVDRSEGCVEEFYAKNFGTDVLMGYLAGRATELRCLRLISICHVTETALVQALRRFPRLEELELAHCVFFGEVVGRIGVACPQLKAFKLTTLQYKFNGDSDSDSEENSGKEEALAIANHMKQLRSLQLSLYRLNNAALSAVLDNCPCLESLDISGCLFVDLDENLKEKCARIKDLRLPDGRGHVVDAGSVDFEEFGEDFESDSFVTERHFQYDDDCYDYDRSLF